MKEKIAFIGAGNMCRAIVNGILMGGVCESENVTVHDKMTEKYADFKKIGIYPSSTVKEAAEFADIIFLAVKPQNFDEIIAELSACCLKGKTLVTIAAGISTDYIAKGIEKGVGIIRVMPNTPMLIGMGAAAICKNPYVSDEAFSCVCEMFRSVGEVCVMEEDKLNTVIALHGSSPAFVYLFIKSMLEWAKENGFEDEEAKKLVCSAFEGSARMLLTSENSPEELIRAVSSPGGTTLAALAEFEKNGFERTVKDAMDACTRRAFELSK